MSRHRVQTFCRLCSISTGPRIEKIAVASSRGNSSQFRDSGMAAAVVVFSDMEIRDFVCVGFGFQFHIDYTSHRVFSPSAYHVWLVTRGRDFVCVMGFI